MSAQMLVLSLSGVLMITLVNRFGVDTTAAFGAALQIWNYIQMPAFAVAMGLSAMTAQNVGAGKWDRVARTAHVGVLYSVLLTGSIVALLELLDTRVYALFLPEGSGALEQRHDRAGEQHAVEDADVRGARDAVPLARAHVLRRHGREPHGDREGGHLDVVPDLQRRAEGGGRIDAEAVDERDHEHAAQGKHQHLGAHRQALSHERRHHAPVGHEPRELVAVQAQDVPPAIEMADERAEAGGLRDEGRERRSRDAEPRDGT